jgi:hypothetical protein
MILRHSVKLDIVKITAVPAVPIDQPIVGIFYKLKRAIGIMDPDICEPLFRQGADLYLKTEALQFIQSIAGKFLPELTILAIFFEVRLAVPLTGADAVVFFERAGENRDGAKPGFEGGASRRLAPAGTLAPYRLRSHLRSL